MVPNHGGFTEQAINDLARDPHDPHEIFVAPAEIIPLMAKFAKGKCYLVPWESGSLFVLTSTSIFLLKTRCLKCFHFRIGKGCGIGPDCRSICMIPSDQARGWTNILHEGKPLPPNSLVYLSKLLTLIEPVLPDFVKKQIPLDYHEKACKKFVNANPVIYRMLSDLDEQELEIEQKSGNGRVLPEQLEKFLAEIRDEKAELLDRLALTI